jgi:hypothetical protein
MNLVESINSNSSLNYRLYQIYDNSPRTSLESFKQHNLNATGTISTIGMN